MKARNIKTISAFRITQAAGEYRVLQEIRKGNTKLGLICTSLAEQRCRMSLTTVSGHLRQLASKGWIKTVAGKLGLKDGQIQLVYPDTAKSVPTRSPNTCYILTPKADTALATSIKKFLAAFNISVEECLHGLTTLLHSDPNFRIDLKSFRDVLRKLRKFANKESK